MKKLFSLLMAISFILATMLISVAEDGESGESDVFDASVNVLTETSNGLGTFNCGGKIELEYTITVNNVPDAEGGLNAVDVEIHFDESTLTPFVTAPTDPDEEKFDYNELIVESPDGWEAFGKIKGGVFELAFWDADTLDPMTDSTKLTFKVEFSVNDNASAFYTDVSLKNAIAYNNDLAVIYDIPECDASFERALQPDEIVDLPEDSASIGVAGYDSEKNIIYYSDKDTTVGEYVEQYTDDADKSGMKDFAVIVVEGQSGMITACYKETEGEASDKTNVVIPAESYIIAINKNSEDFEKFVSEAEIYKYVILYNINFEVSGEVELGGELTDAGFTIVDREPITKDNVNVVYDANALTVTVYESSTDISVFKSMFKNDIIVKDADGNEVDSGFVVSGMKIDFRSGVEVIVLGDVNSDGMVNQYDYILIKRHYFNTYMLKGVSYKAACTFNKKSVEVYDYLNVKRIHFGTLKQKDLM